MKCRLRHNVVSDGRFYPRDTIVDDQMLGRLKTEEYVSYDLEEGTGGKILILREANFTTTRVDHDGVRVSFPVMRAAGELISREEIPDGWKEGEDYKSNWTPEERAEVQAKENEAYLKQFQPEPLEPAVQAGWRNR
jgi:hypothetical protein